MAVIASEVDIAASPEEILEVLADLDHYPSWSEVHKKAHVDTTWPDGRPHRATMDVAAVGLTDQQVLDYQWRRTGVEWSLARSGQQRNQHGSYDITEGPNHTSHVRYELSIDPLVPMPGFIVRQVMKKAVTAATTGLKRRMESTARGQ